MMEAAERENIIRCVENVERELAGMNLNTSGYVPMDLRVMVIPDPAEERIGSIIITDAAREQNKWATTTGTFVEAGVNAWAEAQRNPRFQLPQPGQKVMFGKYARRAEMKAPDGTEYWIMNDEDVVAFARVEDGG